MLDLSVNGGNEADCLTTGPEPEAGGAGGAGGAGACEGGDEGPLFRVVEEGDALLPFVLGVAEAEKGVDEEESAAFPADRVLL